jgi:hypothetical protein
MPREPCFEHCMSEKRKLKPINEVLRSPRFQREVSLLLLFFAALALIFSVLLFASGSSEETVLLAAFAGVAQASIYFILAMFIRFGSVKALVLAGLLFAADTLLTLFGPSWEDARGMIIGRGLLILVLIRYIRKERRADVSETQN